MAMSTTGIQSERIFAKTALLKKIGAFNEKKVTMAARTSNRTNCWFFSSTLTFSTIYPLESA